MSETSNRSSINIKDHKNNVQYCNKLISYYNKGYTTVSRERAYDLYEQAIKSKLELHKLGIHVNIEQPDRINL